MSLNRGAHYLNHCRGDHYPNHNRGVRCLNPCLSNLYRTWNLDMGHLQLCLYRSSDGVTATAVNLDPTRGSTIDHKNRLSTIRLVAALLSNV